MKPDPPITCLFLDIGGVLLSDGWNHQARRRAATTFALDRAEMEQRHARVFDGYERGEMTLDEYLDLVVFHERRPFTRAQFRRFMFAQSKPYPEVIAARLGIRSVLHTDCESTRASLFGFGLHDDGASP